MERNQSPVEAVAASIDAGELSAMPPSEVVLRMRNLHKTYLLGIEGVPALRGVTVDVQQGEFICILGKSGGGKTTMLNVIGTVDRPTRGDMYLCGTRIDSKTSDATLAQLRLMDLGFVFQTFNLLPTLTALENVELPMVLAGWGTPGKRRARAQQLLARVGMSERLHHTPSALSGGEQQRVTIARALANSPRVLLLDEPTGDLDTVNTSIVLSILTHLNRVEGVTCIMVTHDVSLKAYAHRVFHMLDGKIARMESVPEYVRSHALSSLEASAPVQAMRLALRKEMLERKRKGEDVEGWDDHSTDSGRTEEGETTVSVLVNAARPTATQIAAARARARKAMGLPPDTAGKSGIVSDLLGRLGYVPISAIAEQQQLLRPPSSAAAQANGHTFAVVNPLLAAESMDARSRSVPAAASFPPKPTVGSQEGGTGDPAPTVVSAEAQLATTGATSSNGSSSTIEAVSPSTFATAIASAGTSTGLQGVAAVAHAMFTGPQAGDGVGLQHGSSSITPAATAGATSQGSAHTTHSTVRTVVRSPGSYATHVYACKAKEAARAEAVAREANEAARQQMMRERYAALLAEQQASLQGRML